jgi:protein gp37
MSRGTSMAEQTGISWCEATFNSWIGCTKVSVGACGACEHCYAEAEAKRRGWAQWGNHPRHRTSEAYWRQPLTWNRKAAAAGRPFFVFCCSLADVFDNQVPPEWRRDLFDLIEATPHLTWLLLTKRPQNIVKLFGETLVLRRLVLRPGGVDAFWPRNAAVGCTVVTQAEADRDVPVLLAAKAALNPAFAFVSMEPLMEEVFVGGFLLQLPAPALPRLDWVIAGGETDQGGAKARPTPPGAFRSLRDQCAAAGVPFHFKQHGEWVGGEVYSVGDQGGFARHEDGTQNVHRGKPDHWWSGNVFGGAISTRVGKKVSGRLLDGVLHDARPEIP